jgi:dolichyl-phosphate-mannose--protein O-mannosyl transferase
MKGAVRVASGSSLNYLRYAMAAILIAAVLILVGDTWRWPLVWDAQMTHYVHFLIESGYAPYRQITDINMPGSYIVDGVAMHIFGGGDLAWRIYDFTLLGVLCAAMIVIALPYDWLAGLFASVLFALIHTTEGPANLGQRDEAMTVLLMVGYAFLFEALRRQKPWMMVLFGLCLGMASSIKPTIAPVGFVLLFLLWRTLKTRGIAAGSYLWCGFAGAMVSATIVLGYLVHYQATEALFAIVGKITP